MHDHSGNPDAAVLVIFGAMGDLTSRKLIPALYNLFLDRFTPGSFAILGVGREELDDDAFRLHVREGVNRASRRRVADERSWKEFAAHVGYLCADLGDPASYTALEKALSDRDRQWRTRANRVFYLALPPEMIEPVTKGLGAARLERERERSRIVVEKPFGRDLASARELNRVLGAIFNESQIFRIDHYLGKETVQNILAFRFGNTLFEPIWNRRYIDHVEVTVAESDGVEHRGGYYDSSGALRDMIQNHLLQILCLIAMEAPVSFDGNEIRNKKVDVLHAVRPIPPEEIHLAAVRGQYGAGWIEGRRVPGYRSEARVAENSSTESFAAVRLFVDNWRWQDVPFYLRTGKRLPARISEVCIQFRPVPHQTFPVSALVDSRPNRLVIAIQPEEGILLRFEVKHPGPKTRLTPVMMQFYYREAFKVPSPEAYETLLLDILRGDATLFMRADQTEAAWSLITPILEAWEAVEPTDFPNYRAGTWGPEAAEILTARDGRVWTPPTFMQCREDTGVCHVAMEMEA